MSLVDLAKLAAVITSSFPQKSEIECEVVELTHVNCTPSQQSPGWPLFSTQVTRKTKSDKNRSNTSSKSRPPSPCHYETAFATKLPYSVFSTRTTASPLPRGLMAVVVPDLQETTDGDARRRQVQLTILVLFQVNGNCHVLGSCEAPYLGASPPYNCSASCTLKGQRRISHITFTGSVVQR